MCTFYRKKRLREINIAERIVSGHVKINHPHWCQIFPEDQKGHPIIKKNTMARKFTLQETSLGQIDLMYAVWRKQMMGLGFSEAAVRPYGRQQLRTIVKPMKKPYPPFTTKEQWDKQLDDFEDILEELFQTAKLYKESERMIAI